jgi:prepilin-type N-terminal cleavage/methylation domain-containing protein
VGEDGGCRREQGLTLLEMMVAVALLLMIVTGLTMMFMQTQRAFKSGLGQVDVFESGRAAMEMITRDLEQMAPSGDVSNVNFCVTNATAYPSAIANSADTNYIQNIFALTHGSGWQGISYKVLATNDANAVVGTLCRRTTNSAHIRGNYLFDNFNTAPLTEYRRVIDGVVRFQVRVYDASGNAVTTSTNIDMGSENSGCNLFWYKFSNNELPGYLDLELGILEPQVVELLSAFQTEQKRKEFVERNSSKIHIFRQQIPIRAVSR